MIAKELLASRKMKMDRLTLIKERYHKLIMRQRQEIEKELQDDFKHDDDFDSETEAGADPVADMDFE